MFGGDLEAVRGELVTFNQGIDNQLAKIKRDVEANIYEYREGKMIIKIHSLPPGWLVEEEAKTKLEAYHG